MLGIQTIAGRNPFHRHVGRQHRHCRSSQRVGEYVDAPVEFMIADDPRVVFQVVKQIDHQFTLAAQPNLGALINVADVNQDGVTILSSPLTDLCDAARQSAQIGISGVIARRQNVPVQIGRVQDRNANRVSVQRFSCGKQSWKTGKQPRRSRGFQELSPAPVAH